MASHGDDTGDKPVGKQTTTSKPSSSKPSSSKPSSSKATANKPAENQPSTKGSSSMIPVSKANTSKKPASSKAVSGKAHAGGASGGDDNDPIALQAAEGATAPNQDEEAGQKVSKGQAKQPVKSAMKQTTQKKSAPVAEEDGDGDGDSNEDDDDWNDIDDDEEDVISQTRSIKDSRRSSVVFSEAASYAEALEAPALNETAGWPTPEPFYGGAFEYAVLTRLDLIAQQVSQNGLMIKSGYLTRSKHVVPARKSKSKSKKKKAQSAADDGSPPTSPTGAEGPSGAVSGSGIDPTQIVKSTKDARDALPNLVANFWKKGLNELFEEIVKSKNLKPLLTGTTGAINHARILWADIESAVNVANEDFKAVATELLPPGEVPDDVEEHHLTSLVVAINILDAEGHSDVITKFFVECSKIFRKKVILPDDDEEDDEEAGGAARPARQAAKQASENIAQSYNDPFSKGKGVIKSKAAATAATKASAAVGGTTDTLTAEAPATSTATGTPAGGGQSTEKGIFVSSGSSESVAEDDDEA